MSLKDQADSKVLLKMMNEKFYQEDDILSLFIFS